MTWHHKEQPHDEEPAEYAVEGDDGTVRSYPREAFDMIVKTRDPAEVERQVGIGWALLDERMVVDHSDSPAVDDMTLGVEAMYMRTPLTPIRPVEVMEYTIGILAEGAQGEPLP